MKIHFSSITKKTSSTMKIQAAAVLLLSSLAISTAFAPPIGGISSSGSSSSSTTQLRAEIGETGIAFENVAREWRCKVRFFYNVTAYVFVLSVCWCSIVKY